MKSSQIILLYYVVSVLFKNFPFSYNICCCWLKWMSLEFTHFRALQRLSTVKLILHSLCRDLHCENCFRYFGLWVNNMVKGSESSNMENWAISTKGNQVWWYMWIWIFKSAAVLHHINLWIVTDVAGLPSSSGWSSLRQVYLPGNGYIRLSQAI